MEKKETKEMECSVLDLLLSAETPNVLKALPTARYKVHRLSKLAGTDVVFDLRAVTYGRIRAIQEGVDDIPLELVLEGVENPDFTSPALQEKLGVLSDAQRSSLPAKVVAGDTVKALLLPGEVEDLARAIERLSGYRTNTIEAVKNG